jgi:hypothetical protein
VTEQELQELYLALKPQWAHAKADRLALLDYTGRVVALADGRQLSRAQAMQLDSQLFGSQECYPGRQARQLPPEPTCPVVITRRDRMATAKVLRADGTWVPGLRVTLPQAELLGSLMVAFICGHAAPIPTAVLNKAVGVQDSGKMLRRLCELYPDLNTVLVPPGKKYRGCGWRLRHPA